jgi:nucleotide-binding universal stress UspA family protein
LSDKAIREAIMLAKAGGAKLVLFHAVPPYRTPVYIEAMAVPSLPKQMGTRVSANKARRVLAAAGKKVQAAGIPMSKVWAISVSAHEAIVAVAQKSKCDLIVMASHGRLGLSRLLLGSETQAVLSRVNVPVLVIR